MKRFFIILTGSAMLMALLAGCAGAKPAAASADVSAAPSKPVSTAPVSVTPLPDQTPDAGGDPTYKTTVGDWEYSLNLDAPVKGLTGFEAYYIHRKKVGGTEDIRLNVACYKFSIYENHIFADVDIAQDEGFTHWKTYRYDLNGDNKKDMGYTDMIRMIAGGKMYFTCFNDTTVYSSDPAGENVQPIKVNIPDADTIHSALKDASAQVSLLTIQEVKDGWITLVYQVADKQPSLLYSGHYRISLDGSKVEKLDEGSYNDITV